MDKTDGKVNDDDQTHHLVAFLALGYYRGPGSQLPGFLLPQDGRGPA